MKSKKGSRVVNVKIDNFDTILPVHAKFGAVAGKYLKAEPDLHDSVDCLVTYTASAF